QTQEASRSSAKTPLNLRFGRVKKRCGPTLCTSLIEMGMIECVKAREFWCYQLRAQRSGNGLGGTEVGIHRRHDGEYDTCAIDRKSRQILTSERSIRCELMLVDFFAVRHRRA